MFCILFLFNLLLIVYHKYTISCSVKVFGHSQLCNYNFYSKLIAFKVIRDISIINHYFKKFCFRYVDAYLGIVKDTKQVVTIEEFATGSFQKYVNNDGVICTSKNDDLQKKAECLVHFSYIKSNKKLMLADIQGAGHNLTDPEIASLTGAYNDEEHLLFCAGNYSQEAHGNFFKTHECNAFCNLLGLTSELV